MSIQHQWDASVPQLSDNALRAYTFASNRMRFRPGELASALGLDPEAADRAIAELESLRLLGRLLDSPDELTPVRPESAAAQLLTPMEQEVRRRQLAIDEVRAQLQSLVLHYEAGAAHRRRAESIELVTDLTCVRGSIEDAARRCTSEVLTAQPGGGRSTEVLEDAIARDEDMLGRGISMRIIYQHTARYSQSTVSYVERVTRLGAKARTVGGGLHRMLVFDRATAVMEVRGDRNAAIVIREPHVVDFLREVFEQAWLQAMPFASHSSREQAKALSDQLRQAITRLLAEGLDDKAIGRRLGMSQRTCQRHISEIMSTIGARSRFQAGYLLRDPEAGPALFRPSTAGEPAPPAAVRHPGGAEGAVPEDAADAWREERPSHVRWVTGE